MRHSQGTDLAVIYFKIPSIPTGVELVFIEEFRKQVTTLQRVRAMATVVLLPAFLLDPVARPDRPQYRRSCDRDFSSGSTGEPKGHAQPPEHCRQCRVDDSSHRPGPRDRILGVLPFFHSFGFTVTLGAVARRGLGRLLSDPRQGKNSANSAGNIAAPPSDHADVLAVLPARCERATDSLRILICGAEVADESRRRVQRSSGLRRWKVRLH